MSKFLDHLTPEIKELRRDAERGIRLKSVRLRTHPTIDRGYDWFNYPLTGKAPR